MSIFTSHYNDPGQLTESAKLASWELQYYQLDKGKFRGENMQTILGESFIIRERSNRSLHVIGTSPSDYFMFTTPVMPSSPGRFNGHKYNYHTIAVGSPNQEVDYVTSSTIDEITVALPRSDVNKAFQDLLLPEELFTRLRRTFKIPKPLKAELLLFVTELFKRQSIDNSGVENLRTISDKNLQQYLIELCVASVADQLLPMEMMSNTDPCSTTSPYQTAKEARRFIEENLFKSISLADLCSACGVSKRTLQYAFRKTLDLTPFEYLRIRRLSSARNKLRSQNRDQTVALIARDCGFNHMGRFSASYFSMFGEYPNQTQYNSAS